MGCAACASGTVIVPDTQSSPWNVATELRIGNAGQGTLRIQNGGQVFSNDGHIGFGGVGEVTVDGAGSTWTDGGTLGVGVGGFGTFTITNGGQVSSLEGTIGAGGFVPTDGVGAVRVDGTG